jgi:dTDP-4-amino-4,6-dideoxygalactose transaminase
MRKIINLLIRRLERHPKIFDAVKGWGKNIYRRFVVGYPRIMRNEIGAVTKVLKSSQWNMSYGDRLVHHKLEEEFADYIGTNYAIAVNTGGMAIQMVLRALGIKPGDEVIHQVDTCVADAFSVMNAGATPVFSDISTETFLLSERELENCVSSNSKVIIPVHMWGNAEDMDMITKFAERHGLFILEDAALAFGAKWKDKKVGSIGTAGVFSFGSLKPIQAGEGGMITTDDADLAKELKTLRHWGEMTFEYGLRDQQHLSWNGRMSEIVAAVALEQLRAYPSHIEKIRRNVGFFEESFGNIEGFEFRSSFNGESSSAYSQEVVKVDESKLGISKSDLMKRLREKGIAVWHANFEPITSLSFFKQGLWKDWILRGDLDRVAHNYSRNYENSELVYNESGMGFLKSNFVSEGSLNYLIKTLKRVLKC